jgi:hypothetical protein
MLRASGAGLLTGIVGMNRMSDRDAQAIQRLQQKYAVAVTQTEKGFGLQFPGVSESFELSTAHGEFTVFTADWHEHFPDIMALEGFLDGLFSGTVEIVISYRGKTPVGHQVRVQGDGGARVVSRTGSLIPLFWRTKTHKTLRYTNANKAMQATAATPRS